MEQCRRRIGAGERPIVAYIDPEPGDIGLALRHDRHGGVIAVQPFGGQHVSFDQPVKRHQREGSGTDLVGERRYAERHAFAGETLGLAVERLMLAVLLEQQHGEEAWACPSAWHDVERRRRLGDRLAIPAGDLLPHGLDDLPRARDHLQRLGDILAEPRQPRAAAGRAGAWRGNNDPLARQMLGNPSRAAA